MGSDVSRSTVWSHDRRWFAAVIATIAVLFGFVAGSYFRHAPAPVHCQLALYACLVLLLALAMFPAFARVRVPPHRAWWLSALWVAPYLVYAAGCGDTRLSGMLRLLAVAVPPLLLYCMFPVTRAAGVLHWQDAAAWLWLELAVVLRAFHGIWVVPSELDFMGRLFIAGAAAWAWTVLRPVPGLGYDLAPSWRAARAAAAAVAGFAVLALPLALLTRFAVWRPRWHGAGEFCITYIEIFIFIAWLEELFFRGFLQSLLTASARNATWGQVGASVAFGFSHVLLGAAPNWRYVAFASVAGWFYGWAFQRSGTLLAPAAAHAFVDTVWRTWFGGG